MSSIHLPEQPAQVHLQSYKTLLLVGCTGADSPPDPPRGCHGQTFLLHTPPWPLAEESPRSLLASNQEHAEASLQPTPRPCLGQLGDMPASDSFSSQPTVTEAITVCSASEGRHDKQTPGYLLTDRKVSNEFLSYLLFCSHAKQDATVLPVGTGFKQELP